MSTLTYMDPLNIPTNTAVWDMWSMKTLNMMTHAMSQTILSSCPTVYPWSYLVTVLLLTARDFHFNVFKAGRSHHIKSQRYASKLHKRSQRSLFQNFHSPSRVAPSFSASSPALNSADAAADLHSVNSSFTPLKSRTLGSDYARGGGNSPVC